ncbi:AAA family ATPase [Metallosphaera hakonensis]|nr:AAA family ATPase [Metallosphaera hakonensis]
MKIKIKTLGPIREGTDIELGDLTVFFGPQNSGKSTVMKAIYYSLFLPRKVEKFEKDAVDLNAIRIEYRSVKDKELEFNFYPHDNYLRDLLPEGEFSTEPSFMEFLRQNSVYESYKDKLWPSPLIISDECDKEKMEVIKKGIPFEVEVSGKNGNVVFDMDDSGLTPKCKESLHAEVSEKIISYVGNRILNIYKEKFKERLRETERIENSIFIPYLRTLVTFEKLKLYTRFDDMSEEIPSAMKHASLRMVLQDFPELESYLERISEYEPTNKKVYSLVKLLMPGEISESNGNLVYVEGGEKIPWNFVSASVMETLSLLMSIREGELVLYEEPETQLYEKSQVIMALILYALSSFNKIVITTHSQTILYTLSHMAVSRPSSTDVRMSGMQVFRRNY